MKSLIAASSIALLLAAAGCVATTEQTFRQKGMKPMSEAELKQKYQRPVHIQFSTADGATGTGIYTPDGKAAVQGSFGKAEGAWIIKSGQFCTTYPSLRGGRELCATQYATGEKEWSSVGADGMLIGTSKQTN